MAKDVRETADISREGRRAVDESVRGTQEARARMEALAERILALSEQAQAIGQIVRTVNGMAEQSNLLALNAGIEAAKAGEAGAGSASSPGRSARWPSSRAGDRPDPGDPRRDPGRDPAAVIVTEEGSKVAAAAVETVREAGARIDQLTATISEVRRGTAQQILASTQQQVAGVGQISQAMHAINQAERRTGPSTAPARPSAPRASWSELATRLGAAEAITIPKLSGVALWPASRRPSRRAAARPASDELQGPRHGPSSARRWTCCATGRDARRDRLVRGRGVPRGAQPQGRRARGGATPRCRAALLVLRDAPEHAVARG